MTTDAQHARVTPPLPTDPPLALFDQAISDAIAGWVGWDELTVADLQPAVRMEGESMYAAAWFESTHSLPLVPPADPSADADIDTETTAARYYCARMDVTVKRYNNCPGAANEISAMALDELEAYMRKARVSRVRSCEAAGHLQKALAAYQKHDMWMARSYTTTAWTLAANHASERQAALYERCWRLIYRVDPA